MKKTIAALAAGMILAACGGGGDGTKTTQSQSCKQNLTVQLFGDSTQWLVGHYGNLQRELDSTYGGRVTVVDDGVSGTDSTQLVAGTDGTNPPWPQDVTGDIVLVNHGANDAGHGVPLATYEADLRLFVAQHVVIETPNPWDPAVVPYDDAPFAQAGRTIAAQAGVPLIDVQAYILGTPGWQGMVANGIHQNATLDAAIAHDLTAPAIRVIADSMLCR